MHRVSNIFECFELKHPPFSKSSDVIGRVLPRDSVVKGQMFRSDRVPAMPVSTTSAISIQEQEEEFVNSHDDPPVTSCTTMLNDVADQESGNNSADINKNEKPREVSSNHAQLKTRICQNFESGVAKPKAKPRKITPHRREQCRRNQERYRKKQAAQEKALKIRVRELHHEVPLLEIQQIRMLYSRSQTTWSVVTEYVDVFHHGTDPSHNVQSGSRMWPQNPKTQRQLVFLRSTMVDDVIVGNERGIDALLDQWRRYFASFGDLRFRLGRVTKPSSTLVWATATLSVVITDATLEHVFPHLSPGQEEQKSAGIRSRLLGQRLALPCELCFEWDEVVKRVIRLETMVDFVTPLVRHLGALEEVAFVLGRSFLAMDGTIQESE